MNMKILQLKFVQNNKNSGLTKVDNKTNQAQLKIF